MYYNTELEKQKSNKNESVQNNYKIDGNNSTN